MKKMTVLFFCFLSVSVLFSGCNDITNLEFKGRNYVIKLTYKQRKILTHLIPLTLTFTNTSGNPVKINDLTIELHSRKNSIPASIKYTELMDIALLPGECAVRQISFPLKGTVYHIDGWSVIEADHIQNETKSIRIE